ncbi:hypothetical protein MBLNU13_g10526t1 [Cladosporium sp. NU13]
MLTRPTVFKALLASIATLASASPATTTSTPSAGLDVCAIFDFQWHVNSESICCPGVIDMPHGDRSKAYCCVGAHIPANVVITTTQTSCATKVSLNPITDYSSKALKAATKYGVTYTTNVGMGSRTVIETATVGVTSTAIGSGSASVSTGGAGARKTAAAALVVAGGLLLGI